MASDIDFMQRALELAAAAESAGEVPVGAVIVMGAEIVAEAFNEPIRLCDPSAHAEVLALRQAGKKLENYRLPGSTLYVTLEPCPMCAAAMVHARVERLVYATADPKSGAAGSVMNLLSDERLNHQVSVDGGICAEAASAQLKRFFAARR